MENRRIKLASEGFDKIVNDVIMKQINKLHKAQRAGG